MRKRSLVTVSGTVERQIGDQLYRPPSPVRRELLAQPVEPGRRGEQADVDHPGTSPRVRDRRPRRHRRYRRPGRPGRPRCPRRRSDRARRRRARSALGWSGTSQCRGAGRTDPPHRMERGAVSVDQHGEVAGGGRRGGDDGHRGALRSSREEGSPRTPPAPPVRAQDRLGRRSPRRGRTTTTPPGPPGPLGRACQPIRPAPGGFPHAGGSRARSRRRRCRPGGRWARPDRRAPPHRAGRAGPPIGSRRAIRRSPPVPPGPAQ